MLKSLTHFNNNTYDFYINKYTSFYTLIQNDRTIGPYLRSNFAKTAAGMSGCGCPRKTRTVEDGGRHNGITNDFTSGNPQGRHIDTIGYRDTRAETPVGINQEPPNPPLPFLLMA